MHADDLAKYIGSITPDATVALLREMGTHGSDSGSSRVNLDKFTRWAHVVNLMEWIDRDGLSTVFDFALEYDEEQECIAAEDFGSKTFAIIAGKFNAGNGVICRIELFKWYVHVIRNSNERLKALFDKILEHSDQKMQIGTDEIEAYLGSMNEPVNGLLHEIDAQGNADGQVTFDELKDWARVVEIIALIERDGLSEVWNKTYGQNGTYELRLEFFSWYVHVIREYAIKVELLFKQITNGANSMQSEHLATYVGSTVDEASALLRKMDKRWSDLSSGEVGFNEFESWATQVNRRKQGPVIEL